MPSILWLREYLSNIEGVLGTPVTLVLVSHDRFFLNALVDQIVQFRGWDKTLAYFDGNYDSYEETMLNKKKFNKKLQEKLDQRMENATKMVNKITQQGLKSKDDKKLQVAASKKKKMDRIGLERSEKGHRFMINRDRIGYFTTIRGQAEDLAKYETETSYSSWKVLSMNPPQIRNITSQAKMQLLISTSRCLYYCRMLQATQPIRIEKPRIFKNHREGLFFHHTERSMNIPDGYLPATFQTPR